MCEYISWVESNGKVLFLTDKDIKIWNNAKDRPLQPDRSEIAGHGAIRLYYGTKNCDGINKECIDFSTPDNFPSQIVKAIKSGKMTYAPIPNGLLLDTVNAKWRTEWNAVYAKRQPEWDAVDAKWQTEWNAVNAKWRTEWNAVNAKRRTELDAVNAKWRTEWDTVNAKRQPELDAVNAKWQPERDAVDAKRRTELDAVYAKYWKIFKTKANRQPQWK